MTGEYDSVSGEMDPEYKGHYLLLTEAFLKSSANSSLKHRHLESAPEEFLKFREIGSIEFWAWV